jgi:hypothetical protein
VKDIYELRSEADKARVQQLYAENLIRIGRAVDPDKAERARIFAEGVEMGLRWAAGDTRRSLPDDLFPLAMTTVEYTPEEEDESLAWILAQTATEGS